MPQIRITASFSRDKAYFPHFERSRLVGYALDFPIQLLDNLFKKTLYQRQQVIYGSWKESLAKT